LVSQCIRDAAEHAAAADGLSAMLIERFLRAGEETWEGAGSGRFSLAQFREDEAYTRATKTAIRKLFDLLANLLPSEIQSSQAISPDLIRQRIEPMVMGLVQADWQEVALREPEEEQPDKPASDSSVNDAGGDEPGDDSDGHVVESEDDWPPQDLRDLWRLYAEQDDREPDRLGPGEGGSKRAAKPPILTSQKAGLSFSLGWHTFRHTYRAWLDDTGAPMSVQKQLMRHASIQTTMNVYGQAMPDTKRQANSKIVQMVLRKPEQATGAA
jgi:hypothetical protein